MAGLERPAPSVATALLVPPATMLLGSAIVRLASLDLAVSRPASLAPLERTVGTHANVLVRPGPATLLQGPAYVLRVTMALTVGNDALLGAMGQAVHKFVSVSMVVPAIQPREPATALPGSLGPTAASPVHRVASAPVVPMCVRAGKGRPVTLRQGLASVLLGRLEFTVNMGVPRVGLARTVSSSVPAEMGACVMSLTAAVLVPWAGWGHTASRPVLLGATELPAFWGVPVRTMVPVSPPRVLATVALASMVKLVSTPAPLASMDLVARESVSVNREPPATLSVASASALPASMASSVRGGASQAFLERAAGSGVTATKMYPAMPSAASAFAHQGAQELHVTRSAEGAALGLAVPCAVAVRVGLTVTPSVGSAIVWTTTQGLLAGKWLHSHPPADQHPSSPAAGP